MSLINKPVFATSRGNWVPAKGTNPVTVDIVLLMDDAVFTTDEFTVVPNAEDVGGRGEDVTLLFPTSCVIEIV